MHDYAGLASALALHISRTSRQPSTDAREAGRTWGAAIARDLDVSDGAPTEIVRDVLADYDFQPVKGRSRQTLRLRSCPLLDVAREVPDIVCDVHTGMVMGLLEELGDTTTTVELLPFAEPDACVLHLRSARR